MYVQSRRYQLEITTSQNTTSRDIVWWDCFHAIYGGASSLSLAYRHPGLSQSIHHYHNMPLAAPLAATLKDQSPNLKTALRLLDAYTSYSDETLKTTFDETVTDDFALVALPESLSVFGWTQLNKLEFSLAIQSLGWKGIKVYCHRSSGNRKRCNSLGKHSASVCYIGRGVAHVPPRVQEPFQR
ncbi:uncharacterized protein EI90DRAFT_249596 [Cantharellus anzutake]|uniref:uncharacterized protein n=1 Tax=Cantharellus anzutake TaxID=1750568 RepID=UPI0019036727|nr:uncharacterized protein EI90DRAFT_249596 [Cantharellus anzutake]KAF8335721.1 hypothetical protein EI90DRAFT_249596 [Cantharellus anzutake]